MLVTINISTISRIRDFIRINENTPCNVHVLSGKYRLNAKSVMNIFILDITRPVTVVIEGSKPEIEKLINKYEKAGFVEA